MNDDGRLVYTVVETAGLLHLSRNSVYKGISTGEIPYIKVGKRVLIPKFSLERLLSEASKTGKCKEGVKKL